MIHGVFLRPLLKATVALVLGISVLSATVAYAVNVSFTLDVTTSGLTVSFVDGNDAAVTNPAVDFGSLTRSNTCSTITAMLADTSASDATDQRKIKIENPGASDSGFVVDISAAATTDLWTTGGNSIDFNDAGDVGSEGCTDKPSGDGDSFGGQLTIDPSAATLTAVSGGTSNITKGSSTGFVEGTTDAVTLINAAAGSSDFGEWHLSDISLSQKIPSNQAVGDDYAITMVISINSQ